MKEARCAGPSGSLCPGVHDRWRHCQSRETDTKPQQGPASNHLPIKNPYCAAVSGTTLSLPCRTKGESANSLLALTSASVTGLFNAAPALILTCGFFGSEASTETTVAVPTALLWSPVS